MSVAAIQSESRWAVVNARRVRWKLHWLLRPDSPFEARRWWGGMCLTLPRSGSAAAAYYRTFPSEAVARRLEEALRPGMTVVDVGAHVGVYTLLAARLVGPTGSVHALEPQRDCCDFIARNAQANGIENISVRREALAAEPGDVDLLVDPRSLGGRIATTGTAQGQKLRATTLDEFAEQAEIDQIDLLKLDAAGNEEAVLAGSRSLLARGAIREIVLKLYHPRVIAERVGPGEALSPAAEILRDAGFDVTLADGSQAGEVELVSAFEADPYTIPAFGRLTAAQSGAR